jgi:hypothetical protein
MESRKLLLENTFAIKEVFSNNEATSWAVEGIEASGFEEAFQTRHLHCIRAAGQRILHSFED